MSFFGRPHKAFRFIMDNDHDDGLRTPAVCVLFAFLCTVTLLCKLRNCSVFKWWRGGATNKAFGLAISRSRVQILLEATLRNNLRQVVDTYVMCLCHQAV